MFKFTQKFLIFFVILSSGFVFTSVFKSSEVCAGWMCCDAADQSSTAAKCGSAAVNTGCGACQQTELKNPTECNSLGYQNTCPSGQGCGNCSLGKVSTACGGGSGSTGSGVFTCTLKAIPAAITLTPGASVGLTAEFSANQPNGYAGWIRSVSYAMGSTSIATAKPTSAGGARVNNVWPPINTTVTGVAVGTTSVVLTGTIKPIDGAAAKCTTLNTINVVAFKQCYQSSTCTVVGGGALATGKSVSCQMPAVPSTVSTGYTVNYDMKCDVYRAATKLRTASSQLNKTSPTFANFAIGTVASGDSLQCAFRYCLKKSGEVVCSNWGPTS